jgi:hypothetical protein
VIHVERLAREAGYEPDLFGFGIWHSAEFNRFAALVALHAKNEGQPAPDVAEATRPNEQKGEAMNEPQVSTRGATALRDALAELVAFQDYEDTGLGMSLERYVRDRSAAWDRARLALSSQLSLSPPPVPTEPTARISRSKAAFDRIENAPACPFYTHFGWFDEGWKAALASQPAPQPAPALTDDQIRTFAGRSGLQFMPGWVMEGSGFENLRAFTRLVERLDSSGSA